MKRVLRIFELTKNEQRVVLIVMLILLAVAFIRYERRVNRAQIAPASAVESKPTASPVEAKDDQ